MPFYRADASIWNNVWTQNLYAKPELRIQKAKEKVDLILQSVDISPDWEVVDVGCGGGYISEELFSRVKCSITGIDFSPTAISVASSRLSNLPIQFHCADALKMPFESESFNLSICCGSMEHVENQNAYLREVHRVLKPGGLVFITTSNKVSVVWFQRLFRQLTGTWNYGYQRNLSPNELLAILSECGFELVGFQVLVESQDLKLWGVADRLASLLSTKFGRYVVAIGRKR